MIDSGALFSQLLATCWWLPPLFILAALIKFAWFKSKKGSISFSPIKNVTIPARKMRMLQISQPRNSQAH